MEKLITIYWRDIPSQVLGRRGRKTVLKRHLDRRFERAIDRAARRAGGGSSKEYLEDWRRVSQPCETELEQAVVEQVARLESEFPPDVLERVIRASGVVRDEDR